MEEIWRSREEPDMKYIVTNLAGILLSSLLLPEATYVVAVQFGETSIARIPIKK